MVHRSDHSTIAGMPLEDTLRKTLAAAVRDPGGKSIRDIGEAADIRHSTLNDFMHARGSLRLDQAERLAKALGLTIRVRRE